MKSGASISHAQIAQATESVEVLANSAVLQTDKSDVHSRDLRPAGGGAALQRRRRQEFPEPAVPGPRRRHSGRPRGQLGSGQSAARADALHERRLFHGQQHEARWRHGFLPVAAGEYRLRAAFGSHRNRQHHHQLFRRRAGRGGRRGDQRRHQVGHQSVAWSGVRAQSEQRHDGGELLLPHQPAEQEHFQPVWIRDRRTDLDSQNRPRQEQAVLLRGLSGNEAAPVCGHHEPDAAHRGDAHRRLQRHGRDHLRSADRQPGRHGPHSVREQHDSLRAGSTRRRRR